MTKQRVRIWFALLLAGSLAFPFHAFSAGPEQRRSQAQTAYDRAARMRTTLESLPENDRQRAEYQKVIQAFQKVYRLDPAYGRTPAALAAVAELYEEMGRRFSSDRYYLESVRAYEFLISEYPQSPFARDSHFTIAEIYRTDLGNSGEARKAYQKFFEKYPKSPKAAEAREKLKQLQRSRGEPEEAESVPRDTGALNRRSNRLSEVTAIRRWVGKDYSRVVVGIEGEAKFDTLRLSDPDRIVVDFPNTRLSPALVGKTFPVEDGYLRQIRAAQFKPGVTRIVLDVVRIGDYTIFTLPNPFRMVIDIHGETQAVAEKNPESKSPETHQPDSGDTETARPTEPAPVNTSPALEAPAPQAAQKETAHQTVATGRLKEEKPVAQASKAKETPEGKGEESGALKFPPLPAPTKETPEGEDKESGALKLSSLPAPTKVDAPGVTETNPRKTAPRSVEPVQPIEAPGAGAPTLTRALGLKVGRVVIDPGHGGHDTGTTGPTGLCEKDVVLDVALRLKKLIERKAGSTVILTRNDDTFIPLEERTAIANEKSADLFISVHANASRDRSARGVETYYLNFTSSPEALEVAARENATSQESVHELQDLIKKIAMTEKIEESHEFAKLVQTRIHSSLAKGGSAQRDRGIKRAPFVVLIGANMPSILAEISFLTNPRDERLLKKPDYRQKIAEALYQGIARYMNTLGRVKEAEQARRADPPPDTTAPRSPRADQPNF